MGLPFLCSIYLWKRRHDRLLWPGESVFISSIWTPPLKKDRRSFEQAARQKLYYNPYIYNTINRPFRKQANHEDFWMREKTEYIRRDCKKKIYKTGHERNQRDQEKTLLGEQKRERSSLWSDQVGSKCQRIESFSSCDVYLISRARQSSRSTVVPPERENESKKYTPCFDVFLFLSGIYFYILCRFLIKHATCLLILRRKLNEWNLVLL